MTDGTKFRLADHQPRATSGVGGKAQGRAEVARLTARLEALQEKFFADGGSTRSACTWPRSRRPPRSSSSDFLGRVHPHAPGSGQIAIFDRSHYEDVLIVRVRRLVPEARWRARYEHIRAVEKMLADEGTIIRKFFLHISEHEQAEGLQARIEDPTKQWKFRRGDLEERRLWDDYQQAYEDAIRHTATPDAPWIVVPADRKWHRDLVIGSTVVDALDGLDLRYPPAQVDLSDVSVK